jgi:hypothetical protein
MSAALRNNTKITVKKKITTASAKLALEYYAVDLFIATSDMHAEPQN